MKIKILDFYTGKSYFCGEFSHLLNKMQPLAERMRPKSLEDYVGQQHLIGDGAVLRRMIDSGKISSFILWGPPGVGKTTLAGIIANEMGVHIKITSGPAIGKPGEMAAMPEVTPRMMRKVTK